MKKWMIRNPDVKTAQKIQQQSNLNMFCSEILSSRGINDIESASGFLSPYLPENPYIMKDMKEAVEAINEAVDNEKKICVFGDYDCDGIVSTVMLVSYLQCLGADVFYYIPEREEGYGMNETAVRKIANDGAEVIITVDNGIAAINEAKLISALGMELIVTDHHQPGNELPEARAVINPHRKDCPSSFKELCGAGVVLKLISAVEGGDYECVMEQFGDIAAIATIADVVSLTGENRYIVQHGLEILMNTERPGLAAMMEKCGMTGQKTDSVNVSFFLVPRINASSRSGSPLTAVKLLLCEDEIEAELLSEELNSLNNKRKDTETEIMELIEKYINDNPEVLSKRVLVFSGKDWHHGVIGIISIRITERFGKPSFIISDEGNGMARGSARSFGNFSIFECLEYCSDTLEKYGGHMGAGGFSLLSENISAFDDKIQEYARIYHENMPVYSLIADKLVRPEEMTEENINSLGILEPFGEGNPEPLFLVNGAEVENIISLSGGMHTKLILRYGNMMFEALLFRVSPHDSGIAKGEKYSFIVSLSMNCFRGKNTVSATVKDYRKCGIKQDKYITSEMLYDSYKRNEADNSLYPQICPERKDFAMVYKCLGNSEQTIDSIYMILEQYGMDLCRLKICMDVFSEMGLVSVNPFRSSVQRIPVSSKVNLDDSEILRRLRGRL